MNLSRIVNKSITNNEYQPARDTNSEMRSKPHKALSLSTTIKSVDLNIPYRIVKHLPFHFTPQEIQEENKTGKILSLI